MSCNVYVMQLKDCVKVGISENLRVRQKSLKGTLHYYLEVSDRSEAFRIEQLSHVLLEEFALGRERFTCSVQVASKAVNESLKIYTHGSIREIKPYSISCNLKMHIDSKPTLEGIVARFVQIQTIISNTSP